MEKKNRILIVDDEPAIRLRSRAILEKEYTVALAENGQEAVEQVLAFRPDLILFDVDMPVMNGLEACRQIKSNSKFRFTKIIFVSGNVTLDDRLAGYQAGGDDYLLKPYDEDELLAKVKIMLRLEHQERISDMKSHFMYLISHETRTPLNGIIGLANILKERAPENLQQMSAMIHESGLRLFDFIQKAALLCDLKTNFVLKSSTRSVGQVLTAVTDEFSDKIIAKDIFLDLVNEEEVFLEGDWSLLRKGFGYVVDNAVKYSTKGDRIEITVAQTGEGLCVITIADQGEGINPEWLEHVFDEFAIEDIAHHQKGQGLSLAIARQVIELHRGSIEVANGVERGAVFTITLPTSFH